MEIMGRCKLCLAYRLLDEQTGICYRCDRQLKARLKKHEVVNCKGNKELDIKQFHDALVPMRNGYILTHLEWAELVTIIQEFYEQETPKRIIEANKKERSEQRIEALGEDTIPSKAIKVSGYIYLLKSANGYYKIGRTINLQLRMSHYQRDYPIKIDVLRYFRTNDCVTDEKRLLTKYNGYRLGKTEWCDFPHKIIDEIVDYYIYRDKEYIELLAA